MTQELEMEETVAAVERSREHYTPSYVLNRYNSKGELADAIWMDANQYTDIRRHLLSQDCEVEVEGNTIAATEPPPTPVTDNTCAASMAELRKALTGSQSDRDGLLANAFDRLLSTSEAAFLAVCQRIYREESGSVTPVENLIVDLVLDYEHHPIDDKEVQNEFETFQKNWRDMLNVAKKFYREHEKLIAIHDDAKGAA